MAILECGDEAVSVAIEDVPTADWVGKIYLIPRSPASATKLFKKPGYGPLRGAVVVLGARRRERIETLAGELERAGAKGFAAILRRLCYPGRLVRPRRRFAIEQPDDVDINEILFRPTRQEL
jgi:hypothetical protein